MEQAKEISHTVVDGLNEGLARIRRFSGPPNEFWPAFLEESARLVGAKLGFLLLKTEAGGGWRRLSVWNDARREGIRTAGLDAKIDDIAETAALNGSAVEKIESPGGSRAAEWAMVSVRLVLEENRLCSAVFLLTPDAKLTVEEAAVRLILSADTPAVYQLGRMVQQAKKDVIRFAEALDLMVLMNAEKRYVAAAMTFCNEIASRYRCDRVSLGWLKGAYIRVQAISHLERFAKKMDVVQTLEAAMEEAFDQDEEIVFPRPEGSLSVVRDHEAFSREQGSRYLVSLPIRLDDKPVGVATCERSGETFAEDDVRGLRILCDQSARRLGDLKRYDRWFGARMVTSIRETLANFFGFEHTFAKLTGLVVSALLVVLIFGKLNYRVEAPFILKTDDLAYLPAPFDGYIQTVQAKVGDYVEKTAPLLELDTRELFLEESMAIANQNRYAREADKARAQNALADMRVARALEDQAKARLKLVRYRIDHAQLKAPFAGIVVEGDLQELLGAPVKKGDILFKLAVMGKLYADLKVNERDIHAVVEGATGEVAFVSRPDLKFPISLERIDPVAVAEENQNVFRVRAHFPEENETWWRPGMSGEAKINVGKRNILWIFTHRTIDFFRIYFWW